MRGQIIKRISRDGKVSYLLRVFRGEVDGKRKYDSKTVHGTKKEAEQLLRDWIREIETGKYVSPAKVTLAELLNRWMAEWASDPENLEPTSADRYADLIRLHIKPEIGYLPLSKLNTMTVGDFYARLREKGYSRSTIGIVRAVLNKSLDYAVERRYIAANPARGVGTGVKRRKAPVKYLTDEQASRLIQAAQGNDLHIPTVLACTLGMRIGEILALRWTDLDLKAGTIEIRRTLARTKGRGVFAKEPKTDTSRRLVPLTDHRLVKMLQRHQAEQKLRAGEAWRNDWYVVCREDGSPLQRTSTAGRLTRLMKNIGLPSYTPHALRHTAATLLLKANVHPKIVQELLGHKNIQTTLDLYSHVIPGLKDRAVQGLVLMLLDGHGEQQGKEQPN